MSQADFAALKKKYPRFSVEEVRCKFQFLNHVALICQGDAVRLTCLLQLKKFKEDFDLFDQDHSDDINVQEMQVREVNAVGICIGPMQSSSV